MFYDYLPIVASLLAVLYCIYLIRFVLIRPAGDERMRKISAAIQKGSIAYLNRQYRAVGVAGLVILVALVAAFDMMMGIAFVVGAGLSAAAGYLGMMVAVRSNTRTAEAAKTGLSPAMAVAFRAGSV